MCFFYLVYGAEWEVMELKKVVWRYIVEGLINYVSEPELYLLDDNTFGLCKQSY